MITVTVNPDNPNIITTEQVVTNVTISSAGVQGPKGETGASGSTQDVSMFATTASLNQFVKITKFAILGDSGEPGLLNDTEAVATKIKQSNPDFVIHTGDLSYYDGNPTDLPSQFTNFWNGWLDKIYLSFGNHDLDYNYGNSVLDVLPTVNSLIGETKRTNHLLCYDFVKGPVHFFVLNSGNSATGDNLNPAIDTNLQLSAQLAEIQPLILDSTADWKVLVVHKPPYTNAPNHTGIPQLQLDWKSYGIDVVLSGHAHNYEYIKTNGVSYIVQGLGGSEIRCATQPYVVPNTYKTYCDTNGYTLCEATSTSLVFKTYNVNDEIVDTRIFTSDENSLNLLNDFTASQSILNSRFATTASLNQFTASIQSQINAIKVATASLQVFTASIQSEINAIKITTASLNSKTGSYATTSSLNNFTSSYYTDSASFDLRILQATNEQDLSYLATTGSNQFIGDQLLSGSITFYDGPNTGAITLVPVISGSDSSLYNDLSGDFVIASVESDITFFTLLNNATASISQNINDVALVSLTRSGSLDVYANMMVSGSIIPATGNGTYTSSFSLGSATNAWKELYISQGSIIFVDAVTQETSSFSIENNAGGQKTVKYTAAITASAYLGDGRQLTNLSANTNWNNTYDSYLIRKTEQLTFSGDYILENAFLLIEGGDEEVEYSANKSFKKEGTIFIGGNLLLKDSVIENNGKISVGGEVILIGNSSIDGTGTII
jgi:predicted phosphodiesterase